MSEHYACVWDERRLQSLSKNGTHLRQFSVPEEQKRSCCQSGSCRRTKERSPEDVVGDGDDDLPQTKDTIILYNCRPGVPVCSSFARQLHESYRRLSKGIQEKVSISFV